MAVPEDKEYVNLPYYHGLLAREDVMNMLKKTGQFVLRMSEPNQKGQSGRAVIISVNVSEDAILAERVKHFVIRNNFGKYSVTKYTFDTIESLVKHYVYRKESISPTAEAIIQFPIGRYSWELDHSEITTSKKLGEGAYGEVMMGVLKKKNSPGPVNVAIKMAKLEALTKEQIKEVMREARLMRSFEHPNVVKFYGIAAGMEPLMVVMELADSGSLDSFLTKNPNLPAEKRLEMCAQASWGVEYLHVVKQVMHRDLAARNCLYGENRVKISDFGLTREGTSYHMDAHRRVPIRWLSPEILKTAMYSQKSDVWAFGIMSWEIFAGVEPYPGMMVAEVNQQVRQGYRMQFPPNTPPEFVQFVNSRCWTECPNERATMSEVASRMEGFCTVPKPPLLSKNQDAGPEVSPIVVLPPETVGPAPGFAAPAYPPPPPAQTPPPSNPAPAHTVPTHPAFPTFGHSGGGSHGGSGSHAGSGSHGGGHQGSGIDATTNRSGKKSKKSKSHKGKPYA